MRALIVSHGQPSDPDPAEADLAGLAAQVAGLLPGWQVRSATLAKPGALAAAVQGGPGLVYPMFMAGGWFTSEELPRRLAASGGEGWRVLAPFGEDPGVQDLGVVMAREAASGLGLSPQGCDALLAAHGSGRSTAPSAAAYQMADKLRRAGFRRAEAYFIEHEPMIASARGFGAQSLCLPFFAAAGGHVTVDLPRALAKAGFGGRVLPAVGMDARVPGVIAQALRENSINR